MAMDASTLTLLATLVASKSAAPVRARPVTSSCVAEAAHKHGVPQIVLYALMDTERGYVGFVRRNTNGSRDYGPMQINSVHLPVLEKHGIDSRLLTYDGCVNVFVGAWLYKGHLARKNNDILDAAGAYHSSTPKHFYRYRNAVTTNLRRLIEKPSVAANILHYANTGTYRRTANTGGSDGAA